MVFKRETVDLEEGEVKESPSVVMNPHEINVKSTEKRFENKYTDRDESDINNDEDDDEKFIEESKKELAEAKSDSRLSRIKEKLRQRIRPTHDERLERLQKKRELKEAEAGLVEQKARIQKAKRTIYKNRTPSGLSRIAAELESIAPTGKKQKGQAKRQTDNSWAVQVNDEFFTGTGKGMTPDEFAGFSEKRSAQKVVYRRPDLSLFVPPAPKPVKQGKGKKQQQQTRMPDMLGSVEPRMSMTEFYGSSKGKKGKKEIIVEDFYGGKKKKGNKKEEFRLF